VMCYGATKEEAVSAVEALVQVTMNL